MFLKTPRTSSANLLEEKDTTLNKPLLLVFPLLLHCPAKDRIYARLIAITTGFEPKENIGIDARSDGLLEWPKKFFSAHRLGPPFRWERIRVGIFVQAFIAPLVCCPNLIVDF